MKKTVTAISLLLIGFIIGWCVCSAIQFNFNRNEENLTEKEDSIEYKIDSVRVETIKWKDKIKEVETLKEVEINKVKELPLDSAIIYLQTKLKEYE